VVCEPVRRRFSLLGDGDTGSPLSLFRARDIAEDGAGGDAGLADGTVPKPGDSKPSEDCGFGRDLVGLANGLKSGCGIRGSGLSGSFPFFFCGENGLKDDSGAVGATTREVRATRADLSLLTLDDRVGVEGDCRDVDCWV
jgi:hypothetical protein